MKKGLLGLLSAILIVLALPSCGRKCSTGVCEPKKKCKPLCANPCPDVTECHEEIAPVYARYRVCETRVKEPIGTVCVDANGNEITYDSQEEVVTKKKVSKKNRRRSQEAYEDAAAGA